MMTINNITAVKAAVNALKDRYGLSYGQMGSRTGLDPSTLHKAATTGRASPHTLAAIARAFGEEEGEWLKLAGLGTDSTLDSAPAAHTASSPDTAALAQDVAEIKRTLASLTEALGLRLSAEGLPVPAAPAETYYQVYQRLYHEMADRLRADGYSIVPAPASHEGGTTGLTPTDALAEITELERVFRKRFPPDLT